MPERSVGSANYRYLYNGMEVDNEVSGNGNSYTTEFRQYDPRLGRWKSLDPLMNQFPWMSPYVAFDNNPVYYTDIYGLSAGGPGKKTSSTLEGSSDDYSEKDLLDNLPKDFKNGDEHTFTFKEPGSSDEIKVRKGSYGRNVLDIGKYNNGIHKNGYIVRRHERISPESKASTPLIVKVVPPDKELNNKGLNTNSKEAKDQAGDVKTVDTGIDRKMKVNTAGTNSSGDVEEIVDDTDEEIIPNPPPDLDLNIPFIGDDKFFTKKNKAIFLNEVREIGEYLNKYPDQKITLNIFTPASRGGTIESGAFEGSPVTHLMYQRYLRTRVILLHHYPNIKPGNVIYKPHFDQPDGTYRLEINF